MKSLILLFLLLGSDLLYGQDSSFIGVVDSLVRTIDADQHLTKRIHNTTVFEKQDGGESGDSAYIYKEYYYKNGDLVKVWFRSIWRTWRTDRVVYFHNGSVLKFSEGEAHKSSDLYGKLQYSAYYYGNKPAEEVWLIPKPDNVIRLATDVFKTIADKIYKGASLN